MPVKVIMPQLGESVVEGTVVKWLRAVGEKVNEFDLLVEIETDKVSTEVPSPAAGTVLQINVLEGKTVQAGTTLAWIGQPDEAIPDVESPTSPVRIGALLSTAALPQPGRNTSLGFISPLVARLASEYNVDLSLVHGSGESGRITKKDILAFVETQKPVPDGALGDTSPWDTPGSGDLFKLADSTPEVPPIIHAPISPTLEPLQTDDQIIPLTPIRRTIAEHMTFSHSVAANVTTVMEVDMLRVSAHRQANQAVFERDGLHLTFTAYFAAAVISGLTAFPIMNASWNEKGIAQHRLINLGIAVSLGTEGLIVPVIQDAASLSLVGLARRINDLAGRARSHQLKPDEVKNGTFTITNHGSGGSLFATPIINHPQAGILGVGIIKKRPVVVEGDAIAIHPMLYLSLTFDHRLMDGAYADGFLSHVVQVLENWK